MKKLLIILFLLVSLNTSVYSYSIHSAIPCGKVITFDIEDRDFNRLYASSWFAGYATAINQINGAFLSSFDADSNYYAILNYCKNNPLDDMRDAAFWIYADMYQKTK